jgi:hypothetical protein
MSPPQHLFRHMRQVLAAFGFSSDGRPAPPTPTTLYLVLSSASNSRSAATQSEVSSPWMPRDLRRSPIK